MKQFKGTKGPWYVSERRGDLIDIRHDNSGPGEISLNLARVVARRSWSKQAEANAKLIAAAPELLEALQELICGYEHKGYLDDDLFDMTISGDDIKRAVLAINKALGEE